jgi:hypothetical protein
MLPRNSMGQSFLVEVYQWIRERRVSIKDAEMSRERDG